MIRIWIVLAFVACSIAQTRDTPSDADIRQILSKRYKDVKPGIVTVIGIVDSKGRRIVSYGKIDGEGKRDADGDTVFEIGSITKAFTGLLLAEMALRGEVSLSDPVQKFLPQKRKMPERGGKVITLEDLSLQVSGLPRLPANLAPKDPENPSSDYTPEKLYQFLDLF